MFWGIFLFQCSVGLALIETVKLWYYDSSCSVQASDEAISVGGATCDQFLTNVKNDCEDEGHDDCDEIAINTCLANFDFVTDYDNVIYQCTEGTGIPTPVPTVATCEDGYQNQGETDVDCGGPCPQCPTDCSAYASCGANYTLIENPENVKCAQYPCDETDIVRCCEPKALCAELGDSCGIGTVLIAKANSTFCEGTECKISDEDLCCTPASNCTNFDFCDDTTQYLKANAKDWLCKLEFCDESDSSTCCASKADCDSYSCDYDGGFTYRENHTSIYCSSGSCSDDDADDCCTNRGNCSTFTCDESRYLPKIDKNSKYCSGITCDGGDINDAGDNQNCCDLRQACKSEIPYFIYACSVNSLVDNAENVYCAGRECVSPDDDYICCPAPVTVCDSNACNLDEYIVDVTQNCTGNPCTYDDTQCCIARGSCTGFAGCNETQFVVNNAYCAGEECDTVSDVSACCGSRESCKEYDECDHNTRYVNEDSYCSSDSCTSADATECCIERALCTNYDGCNDATEYVDDSAYCVKESCDSNDMGNCCKSKAACSTYNCTICFELVDGAYCSGSSCNDSDDFSTCCAEIGSDVDDSKGVTVTWSVLLGGESAEMAVLDDISDSIAILLNLTCRFVNASYAANGADWEITYEFFVSTVKNNNAGKELEAHLNKSSSIDVLVAHTVSNLGVDITMKSLSLTSEGEETISGESDDDDDGLSVGVIIAIVVVILLLIAFGGFAVYKHKQSQKGGVTNLTQMADM
jgi:hypothetical protein